MKEKELKRKLEELERIAIEKHNAEELLLRWQTVNLVLQGVFTPGSQQGVADGL